MEKDPLEIRTATPRIVAQPRKLERQNTTSSGTDMAETLSYTHTLMHGRYSADLSNFAKDEARKLKLLAKRRKAEERRREKEQLGEEQGPVWRACYWIWDNTFARFGEECMYLALLGIVMALISYLVDVGVYLCTNARMWLYRDILNSSPLMQYFAWVFPAVCLVLFAAGFTHLVAPQAAGSGIPEMKTILRGVVLKEYLTFKTLIAKVVGLMAALGSGIPIGKEGPFVHMACIVATLLGKLRFRAIYDNKSHHIEMLVVACAVGIGACFAAPVGGVLFSIEATATYFAVRNCWRGFFAAVCGSSAFLLMAVWFQNAATVKALFLTNFTSEFPFAPQELFAFALLGAISGFLGAGYVWLHRKYVAFIRSNKKINDFLQKNRFLYPTIIAVIVTSVSFPLGTGQFMGAELSTHDQLTELFSNFTFSQADPSVDQADIISHWRTKSTGVFLNLGCYALFVYVFSVICYTLPVPSGSFIPVFKIGAGLGRLFGELMHVLFPQGVLYGGVLSSIVPGGYAVAGAAAFASGVTHTVSEAVIIFEVTGQVTHVVPVMIASLIATAVAELLQPSMYDSMILIKKLPYLPDLLPTSSKMYNTLVDDFMTRDVKFIWHGITYQKLKEILHENRDIRSFPLVDSPESMILLGSIQRTELLSLVDKQIGLEKRMEIAQKWFYAAEQRVVERQDQQLTRRRSSRFEVFPAPDILAKSAQEEPPMEKLAEVATPPAYDKLEEVVTEPAYEAQPKSILKKVNSFTKSFEDILKDSKKDVEGCDISTVPDTTDGHQMSNLKKVQLTGDCVIDMSPEDKKLWECEELSKPINLDEHNVTIDPSPFQLVEKTSIIKVHTLFNMAGINRAYVTKIGRLVGVVGLKELRQAIEDINSNTQPPKQQHDEAAKPLIDHNRSHKDVNTTITSMDSAVSVGY